MSRSNLFVGFIYYISFVFIIVVALSTVRILTSSGEEEKPYPKVLLVSGAPTIKKVASGSWESLPLGTIIAKGDEIKTGKNGAVEIGLSGDSAVKIGAESHVIVKDVETVEVTRLYTNRFELLYGKIRAAVAPFVNKKSSFVIETENATVGVRGTQFGVAHDPERKETDIACLDGSVELKPKDVVKKGLKPIIVTANEGISLFSGKFPEKPQKWAVDKMGGFFKGMDFRSGEIKNFLLEGGKKLESTGETVVESVEGGIKTGTEKTGEGAEKVGSEGKKVIKKIEDVFR